MSLKDYKLVDKAKKHYVLEHKDGTKFVVAHEGLSDELHQKIQKFSKGTDAEGVQPDESEEDQSGTIPEFAYAGPGSEVQPPLSERVGAGVASLAKTLLPYTPVGLGISAAKKIAPVGKSFVKGLTGAPSEETPVSTEAATSMDMPPTEIISTQPEMQPQVSREPSTPGLDLTEMGGMAELDAQKKLGKQQADLYKKSEDIIRQSQIDYEKKVKERDDELAAREKDMADNKVDPNRVWNDMGTGSKILAGISILLGSGSQGQENAALKVLNNIIDRDIQAQAKNLDHKNNMLSYYMKKTGNQLEASLMLRDSQLAAAKVQMDKLTAQNQSAMAQAQKIKLAGLIQQQRDQIKGQMNALAQSVSSVTQGMSPEESNMRAAQDKDYNQSRIKVGGRYYEAKSKEEAKEIRERQSKIEPLKDVVRRLSELGPSALNPASQSRAEADSLMSTGVLMVKDIYKLGVLSEGDKKIAEGILKDPRSLKGLVQGDAKMKTFFKTLENSIEDDYKSKLSGYKGSVRSQVKPGFGK